MKWVLALVLLTTSACGTSMSAVDCTRDKPEPGVMTACHVPGWPERDVIVRLPKKARLDAPLVLGFHGAGSRKEAFIPITCSDGEDGASSCISSAADVRGAVLALPDGQDHGGNLRSWNDGRRLVGMHCNASCQAEVDDVAYVDAVLALLDQVAPHDPRRVYATGISNGAGMVHRLACQRSERITAIAAVAGTNRFASGDACEPTRPVAVLQIHGIDDPVWPYRGGESEVGDGAYPSVAAGITGANATLPDAGDDLGWVLRDGCSKDHSDNKLPDRVADRTTSVVQSWSECSAGTEVRLVTIRGAGHTWPGGFQYADPNAIGRVARDFDGSAYILEWLLRFRL